MPGSLYPIVTCVFGVLCPYNLISQTDVGVYLNISVSCQC